MEKPKLKIKGRSITEDDLQEENPMCKFCDYADKENHNLCIGKMMTHKPNFCIHKDKVVKRE